MSLAEYLRDDAPEYLRRWAKNVHPGIRTRMPKPDPPPARMVIVAVVRDAEMRLGMKRNQAALYAARTLRIGRATVFRALRTMR